MNIDFTDINAYLITKKQKRVGLTEEQIQNSEDQQNYDLVQSYGDNFWSGMSKWGYETKKLTPYQIDLAANVASRIHNSRKMDNKTVVRAVRLLDYVIEINTEIDQFEDLGIYRVTKVKDERRIIDIKEFENITQEQWIRSLEVGLKTKKLKLFHKSIFKQFSKKKSTITQKQLIYLDEIVEVGKKFNIIE